MSTSHVLRGPGTLDRLGERLDDLLRAADAPVTARRAWLRTWVDAFPEAEPWAVVIEGPGGRLDGAALLAMRRRGPFTSFVAIGDGPSDYLRLPVRSPDVAPRLAASVNAALRRVPGPWQLRLQFLPPRDPVAAAIARALPWASIVPSEGAPRVRLGEDRNPRSYMTRNAWQTERSGWNRIRRAGLAASMRCLDTAEALEEALPEIEAIRRRRDAETGRRTSLEDERGRRFWTTVLLEHAARGELEVLTLELDGQTASYVVCFRDGPSVRLWDGRLDPEFSHYSAGRLIDFASLRRALGDERVSEYDWMRGVEPYKLRTTTDVVELETLLAWSSTPVAAAVGGPRLAKVKLKPVVERHPILQRAVARVRGHPPATAKQSTKREDWVLVTDTGDAQARSAVAAVRALAQAGFAPAVATSGAHSLGAASRFARRRIEVPAADDPGFAAAIRAELKRERYVTVLPASDGAIIALDAPGADLVDKAKLADRARAAGMPTPPTRVFPSAAALLEDATGLEYPVVIKPAVRGSGRQRPAYRADGPSQIASDLDGEFIVQPFVEEPIHSVSGVVRRGRFVAACHQRYLRTWPPRCGTSSAAVTTEPDEELEQRLIRLLEGFEGIFQAQFAGPYLLDLNPRVYGSLPLAVAAGANLVEIHCRALRGERVEPVRARPGIYYRWMEGDVRALFAGVSEGDLGPIEAAAELLPRPGAAHSTESLRDPGPMLLRLRYALGRRT